MAQQNDIAGKVLNLGIIAGVVVGLYFLYKWLSGHIGNGGGDTLFGGSPVPSTGNGNNPGIVQQIKTVADKISDSYKKEIGHPTHIAVVGYQLQLANRSAKVYKSKPGTNIVINKALKAVNALSDTDFMAAIAEWQKHDKFKDVYDTELAGNQVSSAARSIFLTRYGKLTGKK